MKETARRIDEIRREWGRRLLILGHHYQRSSVIRHADERGDSLELARLAADVKGDVIVLCGVGFVFLSAQMTEVMFGTNIYPVTATMVEVAGGMYLLD